MTTKRWGIINADCIEAMAVMPESSIDAICTDPPYGLSMMGLKWDRPGERAKGSTDNQAFQQWCQTWGEQALRVLKPGGHILSFGGTRTYHRLTSGLEDAGFEIRDSLMWMYGQGFPKSHNITLAIDKEKGLVNKRGRAIPTASTHLPSGKYAEEKLTPNPVKAYQPISEEAKRWDGFGTALKPAFEPICLARKTLDGTVAGNVLTHGTGGINIDSCRIGTSKNVPSSFSSRTSGVTLSGSVDGSLRNEDMMGSGRDPNVGRWPANILLSHHPDCNLIGKKTVKGHTINRFDNGSKPFGDGDGHEYSSETLADDEIPVYDCDSYCPVGILDLQVPDASRFFYCAKASTKEREAGLEDFSAERVQKGIHADERVWDIPGSLSKKRANDHATVKPLELMAYLVRLVTPPNGIVLDPFAGSGTTGIAAVKGGFQFIGIEREEHYCDIARARIQHHDS